MSDNGNTRTYDLVIFGASGFTGQFTVEEMARIVEKESASGRNINWAIAGRSEAKLKETLRACSEATKIEKLKSVPIILADVGNATSLADMAKQTRLLVSCVGPYRFFGEPVVKACVDSGTHYLDVSGEPQFLEGMQLKYNEAARSKGVYIVGSCGWDSIPCEMGILFTERSAPGPLNSVEGFYRFLPGPHGSAAHYGTWQSAIHGFAHRKELVGIRKQLYPQQRQQQQQRPKYRLAPRALASWSRETDSWCVPFPGSDRSVVMRTQRALRDQQHGINSGGSGLQFFPYVQVGSLFSAVAVLLLGSVFGILASFRPTRRLLEAFPRVFSLGMFSHQGPTRRQVETSGFTMTFVGVGWRGGDVDPSAAEQPRCRTVTRLAGPEPGYICTPICLLQAALCVLLESDSLPRKGGVYTPGVAFRNTKLIERLISSGLEFKKLVVDDVSQ